MTVCVCLCFYEGVCIPDTPHFLTRLLYLVSVDRLEAHLWHSRVLSPPLLQILKINMLVSYPELNLMRMNHL